MEYWKNVSDDEVEKRRRVFDRARDGGSTDPYIRRRRARIEYERDLVKFQHLHILTPDERFALTKAIGLDGGWPLDDVDVAAIMNISVQRLEELYESAFKKLDELDVDTPPYE